MQNRRWTDNQVPLTPEEITAEFEQLKRDERVCDCDLCRTQHVQSMFGVVRDEARRERDEAAERTKEVEDILEQTQIRLDKAIVLLREAPDRLRLADDGLGERIDAFLSRLDAGKVTR